MNTEIKEIFGEPDGIHFQADVDIDEVLYFIETKLEKRIGMLRQWLNEDRIKKAEKFVTNEELKKWIWE